MAAPFGRLRTLLCAASAAASVAAVLGAGAFLSATPAYAESNCPNGAIRDAQGAFAKVLPDCRAYELVSAGSDPRVGILGNAEGSLASIQGDRFAYDSLYPAASAQSSSFFYLSIRGKDGWSPQVAAPQDSVNPSNRFECEQEINFSPDLFKSVLGDGRHLPEGVCQSPEEELVPGAPSGYRNLFLREDATVASYRLVNVTPESAVPGDALFVAGSTDFSHIVFTDTAQLTPEAPAGASLYEWANGAVHLVTVLPNGKPTQGGIVGTMTTFESFAQAQHAVSADGERVYFYSQGNLYMRLNAAQQPTLSGECSLAEPERACTVQIDESHGNGASGGGTFAEASADGSKVFFTDQSRLTGDSTAEPGKSDLYEYDVQSGQPTDLTPNGSGAGFVGASADGSYVYFTSPGVLTGAEENEHHEKAEPGRPNLYMRHAGNTTFVANFENAGHTAFGFREAHVSPSGRFLVFTSRDPLTGYDSAPADPQKCQDQTKTPAEPAPCEEIFLYDASTSQLNCVSCGPEGSVPTADNFLAGPQIFGEGRPSAAYVPRVVDNNGRAFFDTKNALVPQDENGLQDVYEYGSGQIHLISSGTAVGVSTFSNISQSGNDVFFVTPQRLLESDTNNNESYYDARVEGGFAEPPPPPECEGEACRVGGTVAPGSSARATASFSGPGNSKVTGCRKGFIRRHGKCLPRKHHGRHHHRSHKRTASHNRGGGK
jgi:hypothetical protein